MRKKYLFLTSLLLLILLSCSEEVSVLGSIEEEFSFNTEENGSIFEQGTSITISLKEIGSRSTSVVISLEDAEEKVLASTEVESELLKGIGLPLDIPENLEDGMYYVRLNVMDGEIILYEELRYYYIFQGDFAILELESYPPRIKPGDNIQARTVIDVPEGSDPWLRWTLDEEVLIEGFLSDLGLGSEFQVPHSEGVFSLKLELFPLEPEAEHFSSVFRVAELFVDSSGSDSSSWIAGENEEYLYFIDFSESLENLMVPEDAPVIQGAPSSWSLGDQEGMYFGKEDGLSFATYALPLDGVNAPEDFIMSLAFSFDELPTEGTHRIFASGDENTYFTLHYDAAGLMIVSTFESPEKTFESALPIANFSPLETVFLKLRYSSENGQAFLKWLQNGNLLKQDEGIVVNPLGRGQTVFGGDSENPGFPMVWYSFGISELLSDVKGDGFAKPYMADMEVLFENNGSRPKSIVLDDVFLGEGLTTLEIETSLMDSREWSLVMSSPDGRAFYTFIPSDYDADLSGTNRFELSFSNDGRGLFLSSSLDIEMAGPFVYQDSLRIEIVPETGLSGSLADIQKLTLYRN